jgi:hypothetical protein
MTRVRGKSFKVAGVLALAAIAAAMISGWRAPAPAASAPVVTKAVFAERFDVPDGPAPLKKQDRLPLPTDIKDPVPVETETGVALAQPQDKVEEKKAEPKKKPGPTRMAERERDVCARHGMRKVWVRHGKAWRCRR